MKHVSLKRSLNLALFGLALLPLLVAGSFSAMQAIFNERDSLLQMYTRRTMSVSREVGNYFEMLEGRLDSLNRYREITKVPQPERVNMFGILMAQEPAIFEVALLDEQGRPQTHVSARSPVLAKDALPWLRRSDLETAARDRHPLMGKIDIDERTGDPEFALIQPLINLRSNTLEGYLVARSRMNHVWQIVGLRARGTPDDSMIVDDTGLVIAHTNPSVVLKGSHFLPPAISSIGRSPSGDWSVIGVAELRVLGREFRVVNIVPIATAFSSSIALVLTFIGISLVTLAGAVMLVLYLRMRILRPVDGLTKAARRIQAGDWATRVEVPQEDELGQLAVTFNQMTTQMRDANLELEQRVTERTAQLAASRDEAQRANEAKSEFLSRMSHELRTPLNAILGFSQLLAMETLRAEQADNVREILHAGQHLLDLINEVLDLARIESGKFTVSKEPLQLMPLIVDCLTLIGPLAEARGIRIIEAGRDCGKLVRADRTRLKQVLLNLLSNAVKYNRPQGTVSIVCMPQGDTLQIRITDTGMGLTPEQQARLFVAFERLDADQTAIEGTGIGLVLSKRLVELMEGEIGLESTPGTGSTFWVRLPIAAGHADESHPAQPAAKEQTDGPVTRMQWNVLCIEDNPANMRLIERILDMRQNIRLLTASAPGLGLELAEAHRPALILLDINLPDMDGYAVLKCLRESERTRDIPVIAISANTMPKDLAHGKAAGFVEYLTKPLDVDKLLQVVDNVIAKLMKTDSRKG